MTSRALLAGAMVALAACKSEPANVDEIAALGKKHMDELEKLRKDLAADGVRAVGYTRVQGASGMTCAVAAPGEFECTMPASASKRTVKAADVFGVVGLPAPRYTSYLKLLDAVKGRDASVGPSGVLVIVRSDAKRGLTWCPGSPPSHATTCHQAGRTYTPIDGGWYAWE